MEFVFDAKIIGCVCVFLRKLYNNIFTGGKKTAVLGIILINDDIHWLVLIPS